MKKNMQYWVNLNSWKHPVPDDKRTFIEVWGDLQDAINYAWDNRPCFGRFIVTVKNSNGMTVYSRVW